MSQRRLHAQELEWIEAQKGRATPHRNSNPPSGSGHESKGSLPAGMFHAFDPFSALKRDHGATYQQLHLESKVQFVEGQLCRTGGSEPLWCQPGRRTCDLVIT